MTLTELIRKWELRTQAFNAKSKMNHLYTTSKRREFEISYLATKRCLEDLRELEIIQAHLKFGD